VIGVIDGMSDSRRTDDGTSLGALEGISLGIELGMSDGTIDGASDGIPDGMSDGMPDGGSDRMSCSSSTAWFIRIELLLFLFRLVKVTGRTTTRTTNTKANGVMMSVRLLKRGMVYVVVIDCGSGRFVVRGRAKNDSSDGWMGGWLIAPPIWEVAKTKL
jgi:hypothetical protein